MIGRQIQKKGPLEGNYIQDIKIWKMQHSALSTFSQKQKNGEKKNPNGVGCHILPNEFVKQIWTPAYFSKTQQQRATATILQNVFLKKFFFFGEIK